VKKYILLDVFERDMGLPQVFDTAGAATKAMAGMVAEDLETDSSAILRALQESESYMVEDVCEVQKTFAWANTSNGRLDMWIYELDTETWRCAV
jgi:hypothetical protein